MEFVYIFILHFYKDQLIKDEIMNKESTSKEIIHFIN
jgi:hypothetical protein